MNNEIIYNEEYHIDPLKEVIIKGFNAGIYDEDYLIKAVGKRDLAKLKKKVITVTRGGKTFKQTVYVKDGEEIEQTPVGEEITPDVKGLNIQQYSDKAIFIGGDTYANLDLMRDIKKEIGVGTFSKAKKGWFFPAKFKETILGIIYSDIFKKGDTDKAEAVKNQKNGLDKGTEVEVNGEKGTIEENVSDSEGNKYNIKTKDGLLEGVDEKVIDKKPETDDKKISDAINNANPSNRVKTEKQLFGIKPIEDIHKYTLGEYLTMNGLPQEDINKVIAAFRNKDTKKEAQGRAKTGGAKKEYTKVNQTEGLTKRQLIGKLVYAHYQSVQKAIENGEELRPEVLSLYDVLKENYAKKRKQLSEEHKRKIAEALRKNKVEEIETPKIKKEQEEAKKQGGLKEIDKENYKPKDGEDIVITPPDSPMNRNQPSVTLSTKSYLDVPPLDIFIPKTKKILEAEKPYWVPKIDHEKFAKTGYHLSATKLDEDKYLVALGGFMGKGFSYGFDTSNINKFGDFAIMTLDQYVATQAYYRNKAKEEYKQKQIDRHNDFIKQLEGEIEAGEKEGMDAERLQRKKNSLEYYKDKKPSMRRLKVLGKNKMSYDQMYMIEAFNRGDGDKPISKRETWSIYNDFLKDADQKQIDLDLQAEHDESAFTKGRETSYGDSGTKDDLLSDYGVKVKRQNGDEIKPNEVAQIKEAMDNAAKVFGNNTQMNKEFGLKISHSGDVKQHASKATGIFFPYYSAIGVSNEYGGDMFNFVFGHEYAHFMDYWIGKQTGNHYASDKQGSLANKIASTFRKNMNKKQTSAYQTRTCECFARSLEMYTAIETKGESAIVWGREKYYEAGNYVNKDVYENQVKPLIKQFLNENKDILKSLGIENFYNFNNMEDLSKGLEPDIIKAIEEDQILKSWSTDLQKKHSGSRWVTMRGSKVLIGSGGKVLASHDDLKEKLSKEKKESGDKKEKEGKVGVGDIYTKNDIEYRITKVNPDGSVRAEKTFKTPQDYFSKDTAFDLSGAKRVISAKDREFQGILGSVKENENLKNPSEFTDWQLGEHKKKLKDFLDKNPEYKDKVLKQQPNKPEEKGGKDSQYKNELKNYKEATGEKKEKMKKILEGNAKLDPSTLNESQKKVRERSIQILKETEKPDSGNKEKKDETPTMDTFKKIAKESKDVEDFMNKVRNIKDVPAEVSKQFMDKYGDGGKRTPREASVRFMKENTDIAKLKEKTPTTQADKDYFKQNKKEIMDIIDGDPLMSIKDAVQEHKEKNVGGGDYNKKVDKFFSNKRKEYEKNNPDKLYAYKGNVPFSDLTEDMKKVAYDNAIKSGDVKDTFDGFKKYFKNEEIPLKLIKKSNTMEEDIIKALGMEDVEPNYTPLERTLIKGLEAGIYDEDYLQKAMGGHKYFKREPKAGGGYKYYYTEAQYKKEKKQDGGEKKEDYASLSVKTPGIGKTVIVNAGRFKNAEGKIISTAGDGVNAWKVQMSDGSKAIIFPTDLKVKETSGEKKEEGKSGKNDNPKLDEKKITEISEAVENFRKEKNVNYNLKVDNVSNEYHQSFMIEPSSTQDPKYDGMIINYEDGIYEVAEMQAGDDGNLINVFLETKSLKSALNSLDRGNTQKPKKVIDMSGPSKAPNKSREDMSKDKALKISKKINELKVKRNSLPKSSENRKELQSKIDTLESALIKDKDGNTTGVKNIKDIDLPF